MRTRALLLPVLAAVLAVSASTPARALGPDPQVDEPLYFSANLQGREEVPAADPRGSARATIEIDGDQVTFTLSWRNLGAPTLAHVHRGVDGANGPVVVPLLMSPMPAGTTAAAGSVTLDDPDLADEISTDPADFYVNLHTAAFPGGAARGRLRPEAHGVDPLDLLGALPLQAEMDGAQEVPGPGEPEGQAFGGVRASGDSVRYAVAWSGPTPVMGHIHEGAAGESGPVRVPLFLSPMPDTVFAAAGEAPLDKATRTGLRVDPTGYYLNLHSASFPAGAVRGQLDLGFEAGGPQ
jgi:CHRD domain